MVAFAHVVNPVAVPEGHELHIAQPLVFESMARARDSVYPSFRVEHWAAFYPEDRSMLRADFRPLRPLDRSLRDILPGPETRKLPLLVDLLRRAADATHADYIVYTNADIILHQCFYKAAADLLAGGLRSFTITRRTVTPRFSAIEDLPAIWQERGEAHPGFDCFVFPREAASSFDLGRVVIGLQGWEPVLIGNLLSAAPPFAILRDEMLTFHLGREQAWLNPARVHQRMNDANCKEGRRVLARLVDACDDPQVRAYLREERLWLWKPPLVPRRVWRRLRRWLDWPQKGRPFGGRPPPGSAAG